LLVSLPVSTATVELIFSVSKIVKARLHNKIEDLYLANSLLVQVKGEIVTHDDIISYFKDLKNRRADF
jgi:hypothetical protein